MTGWKDFLQPDFAQMRQLLKAPVIFDGRNHPSQLKAAGFVDHSICRVSVQ